MFIDLKYDLKLYFFVFFAYVPYFDRSLRKHNHSEPIMLFHRFLSPERGYRRILGSTNTSIFILSPSKASFVQEREMVTALLGTYVIQEEYSVE